MTEPDEALLYAREHWATICDEDGFPEVAEAYRRGDRDEFLRDDIEAYRAGAADAVDGVAELEARVAELEAALRPSMWVGPTGIDISFSAPGRPLSSNPVDDSGWADTEVKDPDQ